MAAEVENEPASAQSAPAQTPTTFELQLLLPERPLLPKNVEALGLPETPSPLSVAVTQHETLNDLRITLNDSPEGYWLGAFRFRRPATHARKGELVNEWDELQDVFRDDDATAPRTLQISHEPYNDTEARLHVQRLRDLLAGAQTDPASVSVDAGATVHDAVRHPVEWAAEAHLPAPPQPPTWRGWPQGGTAGLFPRVARHVRTLPRCLRALHLSAWNPPPKPYALQGHLLYLVADTLEGESLHITASVHGFYVSASSALRFAPQPATTRPALHSASLFDLLAAASPQFLENFARLFNDAVSTRDYFSALPVMNSLPATPWLAREPKHEPDMLRTQNAFLLSGAVSADTLDGSRDWNEELQSSRELPRSSLAERLMRDRVLNRLHSEFTLAAARVVPRVAAGDVTPMNPADAPAAHMYLFNNLFVTRGVDSVGMYDYLGGNAAAHVAVGKDVQGVRSLGVLDVAGLGLLGTVVIDWLGERWVVQTVLPGLFRQVAADAAASQSDGATASHVAYGGVEGPDAIHTDPAFHTLLRTAGKALHLAEHKMRDADGKEHDLCLSVDCKGLRGTDGRMYVLDLSHLCPMDVLWLERDMSGPICEDAAAAASAPKDDSESTYPHRLPLLRPELVETYWDMKLHEFARSKLAETREAGQTRVDVSDFDLAFHPDAFAEFRSSAGGETKVVRPATDESVPSVAAVRTLSTHLRDNVLVRLVSDVAAGLISASDGIALTQQLHARGINMRYLGHIAHLCQPSQRERWDSTVVAKLGAGHEALVSAYRRVVIHEMIARAAKHVLRACLRCAAATDAPACIAHFANCFLGTDRELHPQPQSTSDAPWTKLSPPALADQLRADVRKCFRFELPPLYLETELRKPQALRALCLKMGIQLAVRDYAFEPDKHTEAPTHTNKKGKRGAPPMPKASAARATTFVPEDVVCVCPVVKTSTPKSTLVEEAFDAGRIAFARGDRELGTELLLEGIGFHEQVYGLVHPETAKCYSLFATLVHHYSVEFARDAVKKAQSKEAKEKGEAPEAKDDDGPADEELPPIVKETFTIENALRFQRQAVTVSERTLGLDHPDTMVQYINLSVLERSANNYDVALLYQERIMELWQLLYGRDHPDAVHTLSSIALLLQSRQDFETSLKAYQASYDLALRLFGPDSIYTGNMAHELSQAHTLSGDLKTAIQVEKDAWRIFQDRLGADDPLTKESQTFLSGLATSAVRVAKLDQVSSKQQHARDLVNAASSRRSQHQPTHAPQHSSSTTAHANPALANRSIDELVAYIQGAPGTGTSRAARKRANRAKRT